MSVYQFNGPKDPKQKLGALVTEDTNDVRRRVEVGGTIELSDTQVTELRKYANFVLSTDVPTAVAIDESSAGIRKPVRSVSTLEISGNSYGDGDGGSRTRRFTTVASEHLKCAEHNLAKDGAVFYRNEPGVANPGAWASFLNRKKPLRSDGLPRTAAPYMPGADMAVMVRGVNDLMILGKNNLEPLRQALRTEINRYRAAAVFPVNDPSVVYTGTWGAINNYSGASDGKWRMTAGGDAKATINVPADFPGGTVVLGATMGGNGALNGYWNVRVDGVARDIWDHRVMSPAYGTYYGGATYRVTGLAKGAHQIELTIGALAAGAAALAFNYWSIDAPSVPPLIMVNQPRFPASVAVGNIDNPGVDYLNAMIASVAGEFDRIKILDANEIMGEDPAMFATDILHPNEVGHSILGAQLARMVMDALAELPTNHPRSASPILWHTVGDPGGRAMFSGNWVSQVGVPVRFRKSAAGMVHLTGEARMGNVATTIFPLPEPHWPSQLCIFPCTALDGAGQRSACHVLVDNATGNVIPTPPMPDLTAAGAWVDLTAIQFPAKVS